MVATAAGLWLSLGRSGPWWARAAGMALLLLPHVVGAPLPEGADLAPPPLTKAFALWSVATNLMFWMVLGALCGLLRDRAPQPRAPAGG